MRRVQSLIKWLLVLALVVSLTSLAIASDNCDGIYGTGTHQFSLATGSKAELVGPCPVDTVTIVARYG